jgi:hypothetical protein
MPSVCVCVCDGVCVYVGDLAEIQRMRGNQRQRVGEKETVEEKRNATLYVFYLFDFDLEFLKGVQKSIKPHAQIFLFLIALKVGRL